MQSEVVGWDPGETESRQPATKSDALNLSGVEIDFDADNPTAIKLAEGKVKSDKEGKKLSKAGFGQALTKPARGLRPPSGSRPSRKPRGWASQACAGCGSVRLASRPRQAATDGSRRKDHTCSLPGGGKLMLAININFVGGAFRADPSGVAATGKATRGEWPPSWARLFAAFVSATGADDLCEWLASLGPPVIWADPETAVHHQPLPARYVVDAGLPLKAGAHMEMPLKRGKLLHPGAEVIMRGPVVFEWPGAAPDECRIAALRCAASRIGYLGCSDSAVVVAVSQSPPDTGYARPWHPDPDGAAVVRVPKPGAVGILRAKYARNESMAVGQPYFNQVRYRRPFDRPPVVGDGALRFRLRPQVPVVHFAKVARAWKAAVLACYARVHGRAAPSVLHGHAEPSEARSGCRLACYAPLSFRRRGESLIYGLALILPDLDVDERRRIRVAANAVEAIKWGSGFDSAVEPLAKPGLPSALARPARTWATITPIVHRSNAVRRGLAKPAPGYASELCSHAGLPAPLEAEFSVRPFTRQGLRMQPGEIRRPDRPDERIPHYSHGLFRFSEPVAGPVLVGRGRQRGLGLCEAVE